MHQNGTSALHQIYVRRRFMLMTIFNVELVYESVALNN